MKLFTLALFCLSLATTTYAQSELSSSESTAICKDIIRQLKFDEGSSLSLCLRGKWSTKKAAANSTATQATCKGLYVRATAPYSSYFNNTCSSKDSITGHVLLNKKEMSLNAQININTAKKVTLGSESYNINRLNAGQLSASLGQKSIEVYYNDLFDENDFTNANKAEIIKYFNLKNGQELKCKKGLSKAFLVLTNEKGENIGNCVN
jgi:hypothetical protein